ncbi:FYVE zinc finger-domain-containing protein [Kockovaella imperatae]|uniref:FYVE zinc finger-domain-containing protein n=1 Tax=Kockovaella imperatae TaxID=4999 RepID=A0A1Y1U7Q3_9TREE|nr:FYVE zinc finger-domain-containing protein [Kockovaella imperatae]ORX34061.1 FYVE zinc finger-domain-containing protein [Kockovaella imperatae]
MTSSVAGPSRPGVTGSTAGSAGAVGVSNGSYEGGVVAPRRRAFGAQAQARGHVVSPTNSTLTLSSASTVPVPPVPPPKPNNGRPSSQSSSASSIRSPTPAAAAAVGGVGSGGLQIPSTSSASALPSSPPDQYDVTGMSPFGAGSSHRRSASFTVDGVNKAQAWLSTWAPRGEGRGRAFVNSTLNGVAGVASQVGQELHGAFGNFHVGSPSASAGGSTAPPGQLPGQQRGPSPSSSASPPPLLQTSSSDLGTSPSDPMVARSPPGPTHTSSTPTIPTTKRVLQPANMSRLGTSSPASPPPPGSNGYILRPSMSNPSSSSTLPSINHPQPSLAVHGRSHLNPNPQIRANSSGSNLLHGRTSSFGAHSPGSPSAVYGAGSGGLTRSDSQITGGLSMTGKGVGMPYKIGFQPAGVRYDRTEEYFTERKTLCEEREKDEGRLGRRWVKLVDLHFNPTTAPPEMAPGTAPTLPRSGSSTFSLSSVSDKRRSLMSIDGALDALRGPKEVWKGVKNNLDPRGGPAAEDIRKRAAEQTIVKWQDDAEAKKCFICLSSFSLSNRKHHCRLCGRVVCSLQPTPPALLAVQSQLSGQPATLTSPIPSLPPGMRKEKCSLLLVADWKTGRGEEVDEGFVGWMKIKDKESSQNGSPVSERRGSINSIRTASSSSTSPRKFNGNGGPVPQQPKEVQIKGVRVCRECWGTVSRKQRIADRERVSGFSRVYKALRSLQSDIEDLIPDFEEHMGILSSGDESAEPGKQVIKLHKQLLDLLAQYEHLSKRLSGAPSEEGSSQSTVQSAIARSSATFLAMQMVKLQALPRYQKRIAERKRQDLNAAIVQTTLTDLNGNGQPNGVNDPALMLQPLLEQEAQLEVMIADAHAQRKYEDGKALSQALTDIKAEITRITLSAI